MKPPTNQITRLLGVAVAVVTMAMGALSVASAAVPADIAERLRQTAGTWQTSVAQQRQMQQLTGNTPATTMAGKMNRQVYSSMMAQAVMEAITRNPADALDVTNAAISAAPDLKAGILSNLSIAFPTMATTFAGSSQSVRPVQMVTAAAPRAPPVVRPAAQQQNEADLVAAEISGDAVDDDPLEGFNRAMFAINDFLDSYLLVPIARAYRFIMPETIREMGRNFFENLNEPVVAINDLLQADFENAGVSVGRFFVNSTVGLFGFFEVAERLDLNEHPADFGQTLHTYGVGPGPFVMLPFFGPSTIRDTVGTGVDSFFNPIGYLLDFETRMYLKASEIVVKRESVLDPLDELRKGSVDYYAAVRSAWRQNRAKELRKGKPPPVENHDALFADVK
ncbi:MAG: phospholipid-binding lipoprotein MlaA [Paracoccaceae bacterium]|jgi:phospholipid-binding lipoprotein MlaA